MGDGAKGIWQFELIRHIAQLGSVYGTNHPKANMIRKWKPPLGGTLKLNVDEAARGKPGPAAIGRYLTMIRRGVDCFFRIGW